MAVKAACDEIRERMSAFLKGYYQAGSVAFADDCVHVGSEELAFEEAVRICYENRVSLSATGFYRTPDISCQRGGA